MVHDAKNGSANAQATLTVRSALLVSISPTSVTMDVNQSQTLTATASGGAGAHYNYSWCVNKGSWTTPSPSPTWIFTPSSTGSYNVICKALDNSTSDEATWPTNTTSVTVNPTPLVHISPTSATLDVGQPQALTSSVTGGTSPYTYQWYLNGVANGTSSSWTFTPGSSGSYSVYVNVTDHAGFKAKSNVATITVNAVPSVSTSPYTKRWVLNQPLTFTESVTGGTSPYTYYWGCGRNASQAYINMGQNGPTTSNTWAFTFNALGNWIVICNVFDSAKGPPVLGPWGSTAYVNVINGYLLTLSANATVPGLTFTVSNGTGTIYSGGSVTLALYKGYYNVTVSPTYCMKSIGVGRYRIITTWQFVEWVNATGAIISTSPTLTNYYLSQNTTLIADYYETVTSTGIQ